MHVLHLTLFSTQMTIMTCNNNHFASSPPPNLQNLCPTFLKKGNSWLIQQGPEGRSVSSLCPRFPNLPTATPSASLRLVPNWEVQGMQMKSHCSEIFEEVGSLSIGSCMRFAKGHHTCLEVKNSFSSRC